MTDGLEFKSLSTPTLLRMAAGRVYEDARHLKRVATIGGDWDDPRDERQYKYDMDLYCEILDRANQLEKQEDEGNGTPEWLSQALNEGDGVYRP